MAKVIFAMGFFFISPGCFSQMVLYKDTVFPGVTVKRDLSYVGAAPGRKVGKAHRFDLYMPAGVRDGKRDSGEGTRGRPLIIWMHGGGFRFGSKRASDIRIWCHSFARRGYLCAAINYRMRRKNTLFSFKALVLGCYDAVEDVREAVAYFKTRRQTWDIDTNRIILAGNSAGGMIALQAAYSSPDELLQLTEGSGRKFASAGDGMTTGGSPVPGGPFFQPGGIAAVVNFWGAIFDARWLANTRIPIVSVHGEKDPIVAVGRKGDHFFGSLAIHAKADSLSIPNRVKIYEGYSHQLQKHFSLFFVSRATKRRWEEAGQFAADFLYEEVLR